MTIPSGLIFDPNNPNPPPPAGTPTPAAASAPVPVIRPDGHFDTVNPENLELALSNGARVATPQEQELAGPLGAAGAVGHNFINSLLLGAPNVLENKFASPANQAQTAFELQEHPTAASIGTAAGILGPLLAGGGGLLTEAGEAVGNLAERGIAKLGENAATNIASKVGGTVFNVGTQGALYATPKAGAQLIAGDPKAAAETLAHGAGYGTLFGTLAAGVGSAASELFANPELEAGETPAQTLLSKGVDWLKKKTIKEVVSLAGAGAGGAIGHAPGAVIGDKVGEYVVAPIVEALSKYIKVGGASLLDNMPNVVDDLAQAGATAPTALSFDDAISKLMGGDKVLATNDPREQLAALQDSVARFQTNLPAATERLAQMTTPLAQVNPELASAMGNHLTNVVQHIDSIMPKPSTPDDPLSSAKWQPDDISMHRFARSLNVILDPSTVLRNLGAGTLTASEMGTMATVYPNLLNLMRAQMLQALAKAQTTVPLAKRGKLNLFMGTPATSIRPQTAMLLQNSFAPLGTAKPNTNKVMPQQMVQNYATAMQKLAGGKDEQ